MPTGQKSLKGQFLLDAGTLKGFFHRAVVLVCEHSPEGAFGLVINRPTEARLEQAFDRDLPDRLRQQTLFSGGPVQPTALSFLQATREAKAARVIDGLAMGHSLDDLIAIGENGGRRPKLRVFAGYAGWSEGQLDDELRREAWLTEPATVDLVFHVPADRLWNHILRIRGGLRDRLLAESPEDPSCN